MQPDIPRGRQASDAWKALSPGARQAAFAASSQGGPLPDVAVAWAAAGYGRLVAHRLRIAWLLAPVALVVLAVPAGVALVAAHASPRAVDVVMVALLLTIGAGFVALSAWARRYQRLYSSGLLGMEAARLGGLPPSSVQAAWSPAESGFTVPYHAQVPVAPAPPRPAPDPIASGVQEIPVRRGAVIGYLALLLAIAVLLWSTVAGVWHDSHLGPLMTILLVAFTTLVTLLFAFLLYAVTPVLLRPFNARFTPEGWELPPLRMHGPWASVRAIRVRPLSARGSTAGSPQLAAYRMVVLVVDDPERHIAHLPRLRRALIRRSIKKYGSPVAIAATPKRSMPVVDLVQLLQRYTPAPVDWA